MFPYHDENATLRPAYVTMAIIALNVLAWLVVQGAGSAYSVAVSVCNFGLVPAELTHSVRPGTALPLGEGMGEERSASKRQKHETPPRWRGATPYCLPTVGLIVPVFGLALAPYLAFSRLPGASSGQNPQRRS